MPHSTEYRTICLETSTPFSAFRSTAEIGKIEPVANRTPSAPTRSETVRYGALRGLRSIARGSVKLREQATSRPPVPLL